MSPVASALWDIASFSMAMFVLPILLRIAFDLLLAVLRDQ